MRQNARRIKLPIKTIIYLKLDKFGLLGVVTRKYMNPAPPRAKPMSLMVGRREGSPKIKLDRISFAV